jgi:hypothetical protein
VTVGVRCCFTLGVGLVVCWEEVLVWLGACFFWEALPACGCVEVDVVEVVVVRVEAGVLEDDCCASLPHATKTVDDTITARLANRRPKRTSPKR